LPIAAEYVKTPCVQSLYDMHAPGNVELRIAYVTGLGPAQAKNMAVAKALDDAYDYLFFVDSDLILPSDTLERLLRLNTDIAAGWSVLGINDQRTNIYSFNSVNSSYDFVPHRKLPSGITIVDAIGFACVLVRTSVFRALEYPYFVHTEYANRAVLNEDIYFCDKLRRLSLPRIMCDTGLRMGNLKSVCI